MKSDAELFKQTTDHTLESTELFSKFKAGLENIPHFSTQNPIMDMENTVLNKLYAMSVDKMIHTIDDFLKNVSLLDSIATGKGINAKLMLQDKLKATAGRHPISCAKNLIT